MLASLPDDGARLVERPRRRDRVLHRGVPALRLRRGRDRVRGDQRRAGQRRGRDVSHATTRWPACASCSTARQAPGDCSTTPSCGRISARSTGWPSGRRRYKPVGWKVYTMGLMDDAYQHYEPGLGLAARRRRDRACRSSSRPGQSGVKLVCAHKGVSGMVDAGSPSDVGPAARRSPTSTSSIYHSGYEPGQPEGPYLSETADQGVNRLIQTCSRALVSGRVQRLRRAWHDLVHAAQPSRRCRARARQAAAAPGEDNIIWGTDSIWYGPTQPVLDAFRTFQIPDATLRAIRVPQDHGAGEAQDPGGNAARCMASTSMRCRDAAATDDLSWTNAVAAELGS